MLCTQKPRYPPLRITSFEREDEIKNWKCFEILFGPPQKGRNGPHDLFGSPGPNEVRSLSSPLVDVLKCALIKIFE